MTAVVPVPGVRGVACSLVSDLARVAMPRRDLTVISSDRTQGTSRGTSLASNGTVQMRNRWIGRRQHQLWRTQYSWNSPTTRTWNSDDAGRAQQSDMNTNTGLPSTSGDASAGKKGICAKSRTGWSTCAPPAPSPIWFRRSWRLLKQSRRRVKAVGCRHRRCGSAIPPCTGECLTLPSKWIFWFLAFRSGPSGRSGDCPAFALQDSPEANH